MGIETKKYQNYYAYMNHQKSKAPPGSPLFNKLIGENREPMLAGFRLNFAPHVDAIEKSTKALCLGARTGAEVSVLKEMGLEDAIGIDLNPHPPLVVEGDIHYLQYEGSFFDFIFSNVFDHSCYPQKFISEIERVAKPNTYCILHLSINDREDYHAANVLSDSQTAIDLFKRDVEILKNESLGQPDWPGYWELVLRIL